MNIMKELTCVMAFINEGEELKATLSSIRQTAGDSVDIVLVDDGSTDGVDYAAMAEQYAARYTRHEQRRGSAPSKHEGVLLAQTPYFLLLDGHMRFYEQEWPEKVVERIKENERCIYCCRCRGLKSGDKAFTFGGWVNFDRKEIFAVKWLCRLSDSEGLNTVVVPCILGASYAGSVEYFKFLRGFEGLTGYGAEEEYLSIKSWMGGAGVRQIRDVVVGHRFNLSRIVGGRPKFVTSGYEVLHNRMVIAATLLPAATAERCMAYWNVREPRYHLAAQQLVSENDTVQRLSDYYAQNFTGTFADFENINNKARKNECIQITQAQQAE